MFGGLIGLVVDASTGAMYKLTPEQVSAQLQSTGAEAEIGDDRVYIFITLEAENDWEVVGWLEQE